MFPLIHSIDIVGLKIQINFFFSKKGNNKKRKISRINVQSSKHTHILKHSNMSKHVCTHPERITCMFPNIRINLTSTRRQCDIYRGMFQTKIFIDFSLTCGRTQENGFYIK